MELYLDIIEQFQKEGRKNVTSADIGEALGISSVKVRQDLFRLGTDGRPKVGYDVAHLVKLLRSIFDLDQTKKACMVGCGNLGRALAGSNIWNKAGVELAAIFDHDSTLFGSELDGVKVRNITEIFGVVKGEGIEIGVIAVPAPAAQEIADLMVAAGIKGIWNFAPVKLLTPESVVAENQSLAWGLITISYLMKTRPKAGDL